MCLENCRCTVDTRTRVRRLVDDDSKLSVDPEVEFHFPRI